MNRSAAMIQIFTVRALRDLAPLSVKRKAAWMHYQSRRIITIRGLSAKVGDVAYLASAPSGGLKRFTPAIWQKSFADGEEETQRDRGQAIEVVPQ